MRALCSHNSHRNCRSSIRRVDVHFQIATKMGLCVAGAAHCDGNNNATESALSNSQQPPTPPVASSVDCCCSVCVCVCVSSVMRYAVQFYAVQRSVRYRTFYATGSQAMQAQSVFPFAVKRPIAPVQKYCNWFSVGSWYTRNQDRLFWLLAV